MLEENSLIFLPGIIAIHSDVLSNVLSTPARATFHLLIHHFTLVIYSTLFYVFMVFVSHFLYFPSFFHIFHFCYCCCYDFKKISVKLSALIFGFTFWCSLLLFLRHPETCIRQKASGRRFLHQNQNFFPFLLAIVVIFFDNLCLSFSSLSSFTSHSYKWNIILKWYKWLRERHKKIWREFFSFRKWFWVSDSTVECR